jgi:hypothetical protein
MKRRAFITIAAAGAAIVRLSALPLEAVAASGAARRIGSRARDVGCANASGRGRYLGYRRSDFA